MSEFIDVKTQIKTRRIELGLSQTDLGNLAGMPKQQIQYCESKGNPTTSTLTSLTKALDSTLVLIPNDKISKIVAILKSEVGINKPKKINKNLNKKNDSSPTINRHENKIAIQKNTKSRVITSDTPKENSITAIKPSNSANENTSVQRNLFD